MPSILDVARFDDVIDASRTLDPLTEAGIEADILDQHAGGALPHLGGIGVRVAVRAEDVLWILAFGRPRAKPRRRSVLATPGGLPRPPVPPDTGGPPTPWASASARRSP